MPPSHYDRGVGERKSRRKQRWTLDLDMASVDLALADQVPVRDLTTDDLDIHYQPIVRLSDGTLFAQEALVRGRRAGLMRPDELLGRASDEGALGRLGRVIREATFARVESQRLFVNIHPEELNSRWLIRPDDPLCLFDGDIYLEITESAAFDYFDLCKNVLKEVCTRTGAKLVVDDFGAGYSNLKRVVDLEPAIVKLDRALITAIDRNRRQQILVRQLVETCTALGAEVVAEGIETEDELSAVTDCGVHFGQGYLLARPAYPPPLPSVPTIPVRKPPPLPDDPAPQDAQAPKDSKST